MSVYPPTRHHIVLTMSRRSGLALLLVAYRRVDSVGTILEIAGSSGVEHVYIVIDRSPHEELISIQEAIASLCEKYRILFKSMHVARRNKNVGCAASVMTGVDWIFKYEEFACILEDDCIPTPDFFVFAQAGRKVLESDNDVLLACGTQFAPKNLSNSSWVKSKYALTWGWATTRENWLFMRSNILNTQDSFDSHSKGWKVKTLLDAETRYWNAGARRARSGYVDVWDTILLQVMRINDKYALLPSESLVNNVGNDANATHTKSSEWTHKSTGTFLPTNSIPEVSLTIDLWLKKYFFKISIRHIFSTRITQIIDFFRNPIRPPLQLQIKSNQVSEL